MSSYNGLERQVARLLSRFPAIKQFAKFSYARLMYLKSKKSYRYKSDLQPIAIVDAGSKETFFGYYDKSPENFDGLILAQQSSRATKLLPSSNNHNIEVSIFDKNNNLMFKVPTKSYNWQQGCRAHWLDNDEFIFNDFDENINKYVSRVFSVSQKSKVKDFHYPVQDSFKKEYFIALNYQRLMTLRPDYGYRNLSNLSQDELQNLDNDGLWRVDYMTGEATPLIMLADLYKINPTPDFEQAVHKVNHVMISPSGENFIFMHRYLIGQRRFDRLYLADAQSGEMKLLSDYGMVSHCFWADDKTVVGYLRGPEGKDGYWLVDIESGQFTALAHEQLSGYGDGHPHVVGDWFVTDTYPDKARMQHLILCNWKTGEVKEIGEFFHSFDYSGETRCDLHPRLSIDGKTVFFDSVFSGQRQLYKMEISN